MAFLFRDRAFGRALSISLHPRIFLHRSLCHAAFPRRPVLSPILQLVKDGSQMQPRFFSSTSQPLFPRPYPHRPSPGGQAKRPSLGVLDYIGENTVFWGIIAINGLVFAMWTLSTQRLVSLIMESRSQKRIALYFLRQKQERNPTSYKWMQDNFVDSWRNVSSGRVYVFFANVTKFIIC